VLHGLAEGLGVRRVKSASEWVIRSTERMQEYVQELEKSIEPAGEAMREWYSANQG
jgi:hypothetical protein